MCKGLGCCSAALGSHHRQLESHKDMLGALPGLSEAFLPPFFSLWSHSFKLLLLCKQL